MNESDDNPYRRMYRLYRGPQQKVFMGSLMRAGVIQFPTDLSEEDFMLKMHRIQREFGSEVLFNARDACLEQQASQQPSQQRQGEQRQQRRLIGTSELSTQEERKRPNVQSRGLLQENSIWSSTEERKQPPGYSLPPRPDIQALSRQQQDYQGLYRGREQQENSIWQSSNRSGHSNQQSNPSNQSQSLRSADASSAGSGFRQPTLEEVRGVMNQSNSLSHRSLYPSTQRLLSQRSVPEQAIIDTFLEESRRNAHITEINANPSLSIIGESLLERLNQTRSDPSAVDRAQPFSNISQSYQTARSDLQDTVGSAVTANDRPAEGAVNNFVMNGVNLWQPNNPLPPIEIINLSPNELVAEEQRRQIQNARNDPEQVELDAFIRQYQQEISQAERSAENAGLQLVAERPAPRQDGDDPNIASLATTTQRVTFDDENFGLSQVVSDPEFGYQSFLNGLNDQLDLTGEQNQMFGAITSDETNLIENLLDYNSNTGDFDSSYQTARSSRSHMDPSSSSYHTAISNQNGLAGPNGNRVVQIGPNRQMTVMKSGIMGASLGAELGCGQVEIALAQLAIAGAVMGIKKIVHNVHDRRERKRDEKLSAQQEEIQRQYEEEKQREQQAMDEYDRQQEAERQAEEQRRKEYEERKSAEQEMYEEMYRIHAEEQTRQQQLNDQRTLENQQDILRAQDFAQRELDQQERQRQDRLRNRAYMISNNNSDASQANFIRANDVTPYEGEQYVGRNAEINAERMANIPNGDHPDYQQQEPWRYPDYPPDGGPDDDPNDPRRGGGGGPPGPNNPYPGGGGNGGGGNGGGYPNPNNPGGNGNQYNINIGRKNPFYDILFDITRRIAEEKNSEKQDVENAYKEEEQQKQKQEEDSDNLGPIGGNPNTWSPNDRPPIIGGNPATWSPTKQPTDQNYPGKSGAGVYKGPDVQAIKKEDPKQSVLDNQHLTQQEIQGVIMAQGIQEQTAEDQLAVLADLDKKLSVQMQNRVKITPSSIYSMQIQKF